MLREVSEAANQGRVWGLIDRDWRTPHEVADLQTRYPQLLILPRVMIEDYCIDPDEFLSLLPVLQRSKLDETKVRADIETYLKDWLKHGALSAILHENDAQEFCRGSTGYPRALLDTLIVDENDILQVLRVWHGHLEPTGILNSYKKRVGAFEQQTTQEHCRFCVDGKMFFNQVIVQQILNRTLT